MTFPAGMTFRTVVGQVTMVNEGDAPAVTFWSPGWLFGDEIVRPFTVPAVLADDGTFAVSLPATDDPAYVPQPWLYRVRLVSGGREQRGTLAVPHVGSGSIDLATSIQLPDATVAGAVYLLANARGAAGGVAALDADGDVVDADGEKITGGGGGGGAVDSVNGQTGVVVLDADDVSAEPSGAVATHALDTTAVHGIANTANLVLTGDSRLGDARTPLAHAASHADGGADEISIDGAQVTSGSVALARIPTGTGGSQVALGNHTHAPYAPAVVSEIEVGGNTTPATNAAWTYLSAAPTISLPAAVGDYVEFALTSFMLNPGSGYYDLAVIVGGAPVRYMATGTGTPNAEGAGVFYPTPATFRGIGGIFGFVVASGDLSGGSVTVGWVNKGNGTGIIYASAANPMSWRAINYGH